MLKLPQHAGTVTEICEKVKEDPMYVTLPQGLPPGALRLRWQQSVLNVLKRKENLEFVRTKRGFYRLDLGATSGQAKSKPRSKVNLCYVTSL